MRLKNFCIPFQWGILSDIMLEWEKYLREEMDIFSDFLLPTNELSHWHPGGEASLWQELDVRVEPDGRIIGHIERSKRRVELTKADVLIHKFDLPRFRTEMCEGFGLIPQSGEIDPEERTVPWGTWEPEKGARFPVTFFLGWFGRLFREGNEIMEAEIEQEMEKIIHYLGQVKAIGGESRKVNDDFEKARSATSKAFWRSVNQIRGDLPRLATHLEKSCIVGMVCNYIPEQKINWVL